MENLSDKFNGNIINGTTNSTVSQVWKANKVNQGRIAQNNAINIYKKHIKKNKKNIKAKHLFEKGAINIFGRKLVSDKDANYYNYLQSEKYKKTPSPGIYTHSFSLYPLEYQPSGSCNFSLAEDTLLEFEASENVNKDNPAVVKFFGRSYNILRIMSGFGGLAFYQ